MMKLLKLFEYSLHKILKNIEKNEWRENQDDLVKTKISELESNGHLFIAQHQKWK